MRRPQFTVGMLLRATLFAGVAIAGFTLPIEMEDASQLLMLRAIIVCSAGGALVGTFVGKSLRGALVGLLVPFVAVALLTLYSLFLAA